MKKIVIALCALAVPAAALAAPGPTAVTIKASPQKVVYQKKTTLSGAVTPAQSGDNVKIVNRECGQSSFSGTPVATATTGTNGTYSTQVAPTMKTSYQAKVKNTTSKSAVVLVRPRIVLRKITAHTFRTSLFAAKSFANKYVVFQRWSVSLQKWVRVRFVTLHFMRNGTAPTIVSGAKFKSSIAAGRKVRVLLPAKQAAPCYIGWKSNKITS